MFLLFLWGQYISIAAYNFGANIDKKIILKVQNVNFHSEIGPLLDTRCTYWMIYVTHLN